MLPVRIIGPPIEFVLQINIPQNFDVVSPDIPDQCRVFVPLLQLLFKRLSVIFFVTLLLSRHGFFPFLDGFGKFLPQILVVVQVSSIVRLSQLTGYLICLSYENGLLVLEKN